MTPLEAIALLCQAFAFGTCSGLAFLAVAELRG